MYLKCHNVKKYILIVVLLALSACSQEIDLRSEAERMLAASRACDSLGREYKFNDMFCPDNCSARSIENCWTCSPSQ